MEKEWQEIKEGLEKGGRRMQDPRQEDLWKEVEKLRKWKEEQENKEVGRGDTESDAEEVLQGK